MLEFTSAVAEVEETDKREAEIKALMNGTLDPEGPQEGDGIRWLVPPMTREEAEAKVDEEPYTEFTLDGRKMRAYQPLPGQLVYMLAGMGRGQTADQRFATILNLMFETLRADDKDYLEGRLLTRDKTKRLDPAMLERIFEGLTKEWFARPIR